MKTIFSPKEAFPPLLPPARHTASPPPPFMTSSDATSIANAAYRLRAEHLAKWAAGRMQGYLRTEIPDTTFSMTFVNIVKALIGAEVQALPAAVKKVGMILGIVGFILMALISVYSYNLIIRCQRLVAGSQGACSFPDIGQAAFGRMGKVLVWISLVALCATTCSTYIVFVGTEMRKLLPHLPISEVGWMALCLPGFALFALLKSFKYLAPISLIGVAAVTVGGVMVIVNLSEHYSLSDPNENVPQDHLKLVDFSGIPKFASMAAFFFTSLACMLPPMEHAMVDRRAFKTSVIAAVSGLVVLVVPWAILCYAYLGDAVDEAVVNNMSPGTERVVLQSLLILCVYFSYPLYLFSVCSLLEQSFVVPACASRPGVIPSAQLALRVMFMLFTFLIGVFVRDFQTMAVISGAAGCVPLAFLYPTLAFLRLRAKRDKFFGLVTRVPLPAEDDPKFDDCSPRDMVWIQNSAVNFIDFSNFPRGVYEEDESDALLEEVMVRRGIMWHLETVICWVIAVMGLALLVSTIVIFVWNH